VPERNPPAAWSDTLADPPREGPLCPEVSARIDALRNRLVSLGCPAG